jgi:hypothetical protein
MMDESEKLFNEIDATLHGYEINDVVPVLCSFLAQAGYMSGMEKKAFVSFVVDSIDKIYAAKGW